MGKAIRCTTSFFAILWILTVLISMRISLKDRDAEFAKTATSQSRAIFTLIDDTREWNASHHGVYVPVTPRTGKNPFLKKDKQRDLTTTTGIELTRINPEYMIRQLSDISNSREGIRIHITSLKPIRPANSPDKWETTALESFSKQHTLERSTLGKTPDGHYTFRYMAPLKADKNCLRCHTTQGYKPGDIIGGITISMPFDNAVATHNNSKRHIITFHLAAIATGITIIIAIAIFLTSLHKKSTTEAERYERMINTTSAAIFRISPDGTILHANPATARFVKADSHLQLEKHNISEFIKDTIILKRFQTKIDNKEPIHNETIQLHRTDNTTMWTLVSLSPETPSRPGPSDYTVVIDDITDRIELVTRLQDERKRLFSILDTIPAIVYLRNQDFNLIFTNRTFRDNFGNAIGQKCHETLYCHTSPCPCCTTPHPHEPNPPSERKLPNNKRFLMYSYPFTDIDGETIMLTMGIDVTERHAYEQRLRILSHAIEQSPIAIIITDSHGIIEYVNPSFTAMNQYTPEESIGKNPRFLKSGHTSPEEYKQLWMAITSGHEWHGELCNLKKDGTPYWEQAFIGPITGPDGNITHFIALKEDTTDKRAAESEMDRLFEELIAKSQELEAFAYMVSHDLKTPLVTIEGFAGALNDDYSDTLDDDARHYIHRINSAVTKMRTMIDNLLDYSRIGRIIEDQTEIPLDSILKETLDILKTAIEIRGVTIITTNTSITIDGERNRISQIFQNLIGNAIKYIGADNPNPTIEIGTITTNKNENVIYVRDNGIGIAPEYFDKVFGMFQRLPSTKDIEGTGVGLAIVKRIIDTHNGRIWLESEPGHGTTFFIHFPPKSQNISQHTPHP